MGAQFASARGGRVAVKLDADERALLARLLAQVSGLLDDGRGAHTEDPLDWLSRLEDGNDDAAPATPPDPAVARLLPDASRDDPAAAAEFRRLTEHDLRARKRSSLDRAVDALARPDPVVLPADDAWALLKGLTDVRLVLAERLGLRTDDDAELLQAALATAQGLPAEGFEQDGWLSTAALYDLLTWWQEGLITALRR